MTAPLLDHRVAVGTGAGQGIGREIARVLAEHGAQVVLAGSISSLSGKSGNPGQTNYSAAKAGIVGLTKAEAKELAHHNVRVVEALVQRSGVDPAAIEDVVMAQSYANSEAPCIGRWAALHAGLPIGVPGLQIDRHCGGGCRRLSPRR